MSLRNALFLLLPLVLVLTLLSFIIYLFIYFLCSAAFAHSFPVIRGDSGVISVSAHDAFFKHFLLQ